VTTADVVVIGAGAVGAACAYFAAREGFAVHVVERGQIAGGTSSAGEGNLLVSDKEAGRKRIGRIQHVLRGPGDPGPAGDPRDHRGQLTDRGGLGDPGPEL